jgi:hypothetical protein
MRLIAWGFAATLVMSCASSDEPTTTTCTTVRDHLVKLRSDEFSSAKDAAGHPIDLSGHRDAMTRALGDKFVDECVAHTTAKQIRCSLDATTYAAARGCMPH